MVKEEVLTAEISICAAVLLSLTVQNGVELNTELPDDVQSILAVFTALDAITNEPRTGVEPAVMEEQFVLHTGVYDPAPMAIVLSVFI